jgi:hypothetical protein
MKQWQNMFPDITYEQFNLIEGVFWVLLGIIVFTVYFFCSREYRVLVIAASVVFITFGISDFFEVAYGSFFQPEMKWLIFWKIIDVIGLLSVIVWYLVLRTRAK